MEVTLPSPNLEFVWGIFGRHVSLQMDSLVDSMLVDQRVPDKCSARCLFRSWHV